jgi:hypothetical protein
MMTIQRGGSYASLISGILNFLLSALYIVLWHAEHDTVKVVVLVIWMLSSVVTIAMSWRNLKTDIIQVSSAGIVDRGNLKATREEFVSAAIAGNTLTIHCQKRDVRIGLFDVGRADRTRLLKTIHSVFAKGDDHG